MTPDGTEKSFEYFDAAIRKDPSYGQVYAGLAHACNMLPHFTTSAPETFFPKAKDAASKALQPDTCL